MSLSISATNSSSQTAQVSVQSQRQCRSEQNGPAINEGDNARPPRQAGLLGAIANALQDLGANVLSNAESSSDNGGGNVTETATSESGGTNAAQALGEFLQNLMAALQKEGGAGRPHGNRPPPPPPVDGGGGSGIAKDLQKLIAELSGQSNEDGGTSATSDASSTSSTEATVDSAAASTTALSNSFSDLLNALGVSSDNSQQTLQTFLQNILTQVSQNGRQGNFINTSA
ncbi:hypothetical protein H8K35_00085 [Undibacterium sp. LX40W]|uniref:Uncharacterized protein n=1 Tax=Undibacterium nitidum TaxID=2762298 RepID=A0A923KT57_9BURK|nr:MULTISPECIES: hypothetical protein [Undibacterium]MBC3881219.1 hypothetical protein [Undibacterium nitidum]MBC3890048.1 hypothetical protein [Undibacterium sp. LX40W]